MMTTTREGEGKKIVCSRFTNFQQVPVSTAEIIFVLFHLGGRELIVIGLTKRQRRREGKKEKRKKTKRDHYTLFFREEKQKKVSLL